MEKNMKKKHEKKIDKIEILSRKFAGMNNGGRMATEDILTGPR